MLIATDLDGTLVPKDSFEVPAYTARILRQVDESGIPVVFITGRPLRWVEPLREHVGGHGAAIVSNGALTYAMHDRRIERIHGLEPRIGLSVVADVRHRLPSAQFSVEFPDGPRLDPRYEETFPFPGAPRGPLESLWTDPAIKLLVRDPSVDHDALLKNVAAAVGERATVTWSMPGLIEISARGVTKASALAELCASHGIAATDVIAFGDMPNDLPMLEWAGASYAVADAHANVRAIADHVIPTCHEEGVAHTLELLLRAQARPEPSR